MIRLWLRARLFLVRLDEVDTDGELPAYLDVVLRLLWAMMLPACR